MPTERLRFAHPAAHCEELTKVYRTATSSVHALRGITAQFPEGALTAVAGPSGSGKSSLLRLLAGQERPTSGALVVGDVPVHHASSRGLRRLRRRTVGYLFQRASDNFFPYLTVGEHLRVASRRSGSAPRIRPRDLLDVLGIGHRVGHLPSELSGGEQARAAVAQVLAAGATIVLADEPTAELDTDSADGVIRAIREVVRRGVTFIVATHDLTVMRRADALIELDHGVVRVKTATRRIRSETGSSRLEGWPSPTGAVASASGPSATWTSPSGRGSSSAWSGAPAPARRRCSTSRRDGSAPMKDRSGSRTRTRPPGFRRGVRWPCSRSGSG